MTTPETQLYLVVAAEVELEIRASFKELHRIRSMIGHKDAPKLFTVTAGLIMDAYELLEHIDDIMEAFDTLTRIILVEQPPTWREYA